MRPGFNASVTAIESIGQPSGSSRFASPMLPNRFQLAVEIAEANSLYQERPVRLASQKPHQDRWRSAYKIDPFEVPLEKKVGLLFQINEAALKVPKIRFVNSGLQLLREEKTLATTDGTLVTQTFVRVGPSFTATAISDGDFQSYNEELAPRGAGWRCPGRCVRACRHEGRHSC